MESWSVAHKALQIFCAGFWETAEDCQLILDEIGISSGRISLSEPSVMRWYRIILELMRRNDGSMARLVQALMRDYPDNKDLAAVCAPWIPAQPAKTLPPAEPPELVPVVVPADFADDAPLTIARLDTLWEAMVDVERRLVEIEQWRNPPPTKQPAKKKG